MSLAETIHKQTKLVTWGGAMVLTSAFVLACINIVMVIINSIWEVLCACHMLYFTLVV